MMSSCVLCVHAAGCCCVRSPDDDEVRWGVVTCDDEDRAELCAVPECGAWPFARVDLRLLRLTVCC